MLNTNSSTGSMLVPIANPETVSQLVSTAIDLADDQKLDLELLTVVSVPEQLPLSAGRPILLPIAGGPNTELAATVAGSLARTHNANLHVITIRSSTSTSREQTEAEQMLTRIISNFTQVSTITQEIIEQESIADAIIGQSNDVDFMILGAAPSTLFRRSLVGSLPERIGRESTCSVIIAKRYQNIRSLTARTVSHVRTRLGNLY